MEEEATKLLELYEPTGADFLVDFVKGMAGNMAAIKAAYPVGIVLPFTSDFDPNEVLGGRWARIPNGTVLMAPGFSDQWWYGDEYHSVNYNEARLTGGQERHTHLTAMGFDGNLAYCLLQNGNPVFNSAVKMDCMGFNIQKSYDISHSEVRVAYTRENSSRPPFYTCFMWERIA